MLRLIGAGAIVICCTLLGINAGGRSRQRVRALSGLISSLEIMKSEICSGLTPLPELIGMLAGQCAPPAAELYVKCSELMGKRRSFRDAWRRSLAECGELCLLDEEEQVLLELGNTLGRYEAEQQRPALEHAQKRLELFLSIEEREQAEKKRISAALGAGAGIMLALLLV